MSNHVPLGPGTVSVKVGASTALSFAGDCRGAAITHSYSDGREAVTYMEGNKTAGERNRTDGFTAELDNSLDATSLYQFLQTNDLKEADLEYTPNSAAGAKWVGKVVLTLPDAIGADEFGQLLSSSIAWDGVGTFTFTAATVTP
jgi:hypothetical protein